MHAEAKHRTITLKWDAVEHPAVTGYEVLRRVPKSEDYYRVVQRTGSRLSTAVVEASYVDPRPTEYRYKVRAVVGASYVDRRPTDSRYGVRAVTPLWKGEESESISVTTVAAPIAHTNLPEVPKNLTARATHNYVSLEWDPVADPMVTSYRIFRKEIGVDKQYQVHELWNWFDLDSDQYRPEYTTVDGTVWEDVYEVKPNTEYEYRVAAVNLNGESEMSETVRMITESVDASERHTPVTPFNLQAEQTKQGVQLSWQVSNDPTITGFEIVQLWVDFDYVSHVVHVVDGAANSFAVSDLRAGEYYSFEIMAENDIGLGHKSQRVRVQAPEVNAVIESVKLSLGIGSIEPNEFYLDLNDLNDAAWEYHVTRNEYSYDGFATNKVSWENGWQGRDDESISPSTLYWYEFRATNGDLESEPLYAIVVTPDNPRPDPPAEVSVGTDHDAVNFEWNPSDDPSITHYHFRRFSSFDGRQLDEFVVEAPANTYSDRDVRPDADYGYTISAVNSAGHSRRVGNLSARTAVTPGRPPAPTNLGLYRGYSTNTLHWEEVTGHDVTEYQVVRRTVSADGNSTEKTFSVDGDTTRWVDENKRDPDSDFSIGDHVYTVLSINPNGAGERSPWTTWDSYYYPKVPQPRFVSADATYDRVFLRWELDCDRTFLPEELDTGEIVYDKDGPKISGFEIRRTRTEPAEDRRFLIDTVPCDKQEYVDRFRIEPDAAYRYDIIATIGVGSGHSRRAEMEVRTGIPGPLPGRPGEYKILETPEEIYFGLAEPFDVPVSGYRIQRTLNEPEGTTFTETFYLDGDPDYWRDLTALPGKTYFYTLAAFNSSGIGETRGLGLVTVPEPLDPIPEQDVVKSVPSNGNVVVRWSAPKDIDVLYYKILRKFGNTDGSVDWKAIAFDPDSTMWIDQPVDEAGYGYYVWAVDRSGKIWRPPSLEIFAGPAPPPKPRNLRLASTHNSVTLTWDEQDSEWISGYEIFRSNPPYERGSFETGSKANTYEDTGLKPSNRYAFKIRAITPMGLSKWSEWQFVYTLPEP